MHRASCTVYYPYQQIHYMYINNVSMQLHHLKGVLNLCFAKVTKLFKLQLTETSILKCSRDRY